MAATAQPPNHLRETFAGVPLSSHGDTWDSLYHEGFYPWDRAGSSIALADLLNQRTDLVPAAQEHDQRGNPIRDASGKVTRKTALVPGCGRGHDALLLSSFGYDVVGLDYSRDAMRLAEENQVAAERDGLYKPVGGMEKGNVTWVSGDFFSEEWSKGLGTDGSGKFDLVYEYTFMCALPPEARPQWAKRMAQLVRPGGRLICLEFPNGKPLGEQGPPWGTTPEVYEALLSAPGENVSYHEDGSVMETSNANPHPNALHRLCLVKPERTHRAGTNPDGTVTDFISVWTQ